MHQHVVVQFDGKSYTWTGKDWYETKTFLRPPSTIIRKLNARLAQDLQCADTALTSVDAILKQANNARNAEQYGRAERLIRRALSQAPNHVGALAMLCAVLRAKGLPQQALDETAAFARANYSPLLTSRAAALCDLQRWEEAKHEIGRVLAIQASEEAFSVMHRIKAARPDLYDEV